MPQKRVKIDFDKERAGKIVFPQIIQAWNLREGRLAGLIPNERQIIEACPVKDPAYYSWLLLLYAGLNRSHLRSTALADKMIRILKLSPESAQSQPHVLADYVMNILIFTQRRKENLQRFWQDSLRAFLPRDPRAIFVHHQSDRDELLKFFKKIHGVGDAKIAHLLIFYFRELAVNYDHKFARAWPHFNMPVCPVDTHWHKLLRQTGIVLPGQFNSEYHCSVFRPSSNFVCEVCAGYDLDRWALIQGVHYVMSLICSRKPKDPIKMSRYCTKNCPFEPLCHDIVWLSDYEIRSGRVGWSTAQPRYKS